MKQYKKPMKVWLYRNKTNKVESFEELPRQIYLRPTWDSIEFIGRAVLVPVESEE